MSPAESEAAGSVAAVLALGSNLGESADTLSQAVAELANHPQMELTRISPVVRTEPVGGPEQPDYLNMVVEVQTRLAPLALLDLCQQVETAHHRVRIEHWGARTLDIDIITYGTQKYDDERLIVPHPRAADRAFVLQPWAWMDPQASLAGRAVAELATEAPDRDGLRRYEPGPG